MEQEFKKLHMALTISFLLFVLPMVVWLAVFMHPFLAIMSLVGILAFYIILGILAARKNRCVVCWVGLSFLTSPIGPIVAYFMMLKADTLEPKKSNK